MEIKVFGTGCTGCRTLYETVKAAILEMELDANVVKEENVEKIMSYDIMKLPALAIDENVVSSGKRLSLNEVKKLLSK